MAGRKRNLEDHGGMVAAVPEPPKQPTLPRVSVLERRLQNPFGEGSPDIRLKEPGWTVHIINTGLRAGRYHEVTRNKGWVPVEPHEVDGDPAELGFDVKDGRVVRGERGTEVLMKMPASEYALIVQAKDAHNRGQATGAKLKAAAVEQTAAAHGERAAEYLHNRVTIQESRSPVPLEGSGGS